MPMKKAHAIELLGGTVKEAARRCKIVPSAILQWPEELSRGNLDRVQAALYRMRYYKKESQQLLAAQEGER